MTTLHGKTALVTGASRGIGQAMAMALAAAGARVLVHYGRFAQKADEVVAGIKAKGGSADVVSADLGSPDGAALLARQVRSISSEIIWMCSCSTLASEVIVGDIDGRSVRPVEFLTKCFAQYSTYRR